jgi:hypothetical protein
VVAKDVKSEEELKKLNSTVRHSPVVTLELEEVDASEVGDWEYFCDEKEDTYLTVGLIYYSIKVRSNLQHPKCSSLYIFIKGHNFNYGSLFSVALNTWNAQWNVKYVTDPENANTKIMDFRIHETIDI